MNKANICREWASEPRLVMIINNIVFNQISFKLNINCFFRYFRNNIRNAHRSVVPNIKVTVLLIYNGLTLAVITPSGTQFSKIDMFTKKVHVTGIFKKSAPSFRNLAGISSTRRPVLLQGFSCLSSYSTNSSDTCTCFKWNVSLSDLFLL